MRFIKSPEHKANACAKLVQSSCSKDARKSQKHILNTDNLNETKTAPGVSEMQEHKSAFQNLWAASTSALEIWQQAPKDKGA